ncbi:MAG: guanylate kinase [Aeromicrobium sp.]
MVVLAGPTAVGKGTVAARVRAEYPDVWVSVSVTTRAPRPGEVDGVHYFFVDDAKFDRLIEGGDLLEWAVVHGAARYGTRRSAVEEHLAAGQPVLLEIDLQGAMQVRERMPEALLVFLAPPDMSELERRLLGRGTEDAEERARRLRTAEVELAAMDDFDEVIVNGDVATAAQQLVDLLRFGTSATR